MTVVFSPCHGEATYTGEVGRCRGRGCAHIGQLVDGLCLACRQAEERAHPKPPTRPICPVCHVRPVASNRHHFCLICAAERQYRRERAGLRRFKSR